MVKQEGAKQIRKTESGKLWSIYSVPELRGIDRWGPGGNIEFKKDGTALFNSFGKWSTEDDEDNVIRVHCGGKDFEGKIEGSTIKLEGVGTLIKQTRGIQILGTKTFLFIASILLFSTVVLVTWKVIRAKVSKGRVVVSGYVFCTQCGHQNPSAAIFCRNCGEKL